MIWVALLIFMVFGFVVFFGAPYVPSKKKDLSQGFDELFPLGQGDTLVDIGSGDGVVLREAAKRGATAVGYEINPVLVVLSRLMSRHYPSVTIYLKNFWRATLPPETTIVYTFGDSKDIVRMAAKVEETASLLGRPLYFMSYGFDVPGRTPLRQLGAYYLYQIEPLQGKEA